MSRSYTSDQEERIKLKNQLLRLMLNGSDRLALENLRDQALDSYGAEFIEEIALAFEKLQQNKYRQAEELLERQASEVVDMNILNHHLFNAVEEGDVSDVKILAAQGRFNRGFDINCRNAEGFTALHIAATKGFTKIVESLCLLGADLEIRSVPQIALGQEGKTALEFAVLYHHQDVIKYLVSRGAECNKEALSELLGYGLLTGSVGQIFSAGTAPEIIEGERNRVILNYQEIKNFLGLNREEGKSGEEGRQELDDLEFAKSLILDQQVRERATEQNKLVFQDIYRKLSKASEEVARQQALLQLATAGIMRGDNLADTMVADADILADGVDKMGLYPIHHAASQGDLEEVRRLVEEEGVLVDQQDSIQGLTPLMLAALNDYSEVIGFLVANGANINHQGQDGYSALHIAVREGKQEATECLVALGADITLRTKGTKIHKVTKAGNATINTSKTAFEIAQDKLLEKKQELVKTKKQKYSNARERAQRTVKIRGIEKEISCFEQIVAAFNMSLKESVAGGEEFSISGGGSSKKVEQQVIGVERQQVEGSSSKKRRRRKKKRGGKQREDRQLAEAKLLAEKEREQQRLKEEMVARAAAMELEKQRLLEEQERIARIEQEKEAPRKAQEEQRKAEIIARKSEEKIFKQELNEVCGRYEELRTQLFGLVSKEQKKGLRKRFLLHQLKQQIDELDITDIEGKQEILSQLANYIPELEERIAMEQKRIAVEVEEAQKIVIAKEQAMLKVAKEAEQQQKMAEARRRAEVRRQKVIQSKYSALELLMHILEERHPAIEKSIKEKGQKFMALKEYWDNDPAIQFKKEQLVAIHSEMGGFQGGEEFYPPYQPIPQIKKAVHIVKELEAIPGMDKIGARLKILSIREAALFQVTQDYNKLANQLERLDGDIIVAQARLEAFRSSSKDEVVSQGGFVAMLEMQEQKQSGKDDIGAYR